MSHMLIGHINRPNTYDHFLNHPTWKKVLEWLQTEATNLPEGEHELDGHNIYAPISVVATKPRNECTYEAHREYIDVHFCIEGGEVIEWAPVDTLEPTMEFDTGKDYCLYAAPAKATSLIMTPGTFAIFFPSDAHMPKISDGTNTTIKKTVVKIKISTL